MTQTTVDQQLHWKGSACDPNCCEPAVTRLTKVLQMIYSFVNWRSHWEGSAGDPNHCEPVITCWQKFSKWPTAFWTSNLHVTQTSELAFSKWPKPLWNSPAIVLHRPYGEDAPLPIPQQLKETTIVHMAKTPLSLSHNNWKRQSVSFKVYNSTTNIFYCLYSQLFIKSWTVSLTTWKPLNNLNYKTVLWSAGFIFIPPHPTPRAPQFFILSNENYWNELQNWTQKTQFIRQSVTYL